MFSGFLTTTAQSSSIALTTWNGPVNFGSNPLARLFFTNTKSPSLKGLAFVSTIPPIIIAFLFSLCSLKVLHNFSRRISVLFRRFARYLCSSAGDQKTG